MVSIETPRTIWSQNPFDDEPETPEISSRVSADISKRVMDNLDSLSTPSFDGNYETPRFPAKSPYDTRNPLFNAAFQRMCQGNGLQKLKDERDADIARHAESMRRLCVFSPSTPDKGLPAGNSPVQLGRRLPARSSSGAARSA